MNKLLGIFAIVGAGLFALTGCGGDNGGQSSGTATSPAEPTATSLPAGSSEAQARALRQEEAPQGWTLSSGSELAVLGGDVEGASGWEVQYTNPANDETLTSKIFVYNTSDQVDEPFQGKFAELESLASFDPIILGHQAFYAFDESNSTHMIWARRQNVIFSIELTTSRTEVKPEMIAIGRSMDDRISQVQRGI